MWSKKIHGVVVRSGREKIIGEEKNGDGGDATGSGGN